MLHKAKRDIPQVPGKDISTITEKWHPLSYYLLGGTDLSGQELDNTAEVEYDNEEQLEEIRAEGASSVALGDPRQGFFDIVEQAGVKAADGAKTKATKGTKTSTSTEGEAAE